MTRLLIFSGPPLYISHTHIAQVQCLHEYEWLGRVLKILTVAASSLDSRERLDFGAYLRRWTLAASPRPKIALE